MVQSGLGKCGAQDQPSMEVEEKMISEDEIVYQVHTDEVPSSIPRDMIDHPTCLSPVREEGSTNLEVINLFFGYLFHVKIKIMSKSICHQFLYKIYLQILVRSHKRATPLPLNSTARTSVLTRLSTTHGKPQRRTRLHLKVHDSFKN